MTPQQAQAQALIHEIDSVLHKASPRLPWVMSNEDAQQRQLLHQLRSYLVTSLQASSPSLPEGSSAGVSGGESLPDRSPAVSMSQLDAMQQTLHAMMQEMNHLRRTVLQPLQADVAELQQQREALRQEVQQLESQRQAAIAAAAPTASDTLSQQVLQEVLHLLMQRLQESLSQQISQQIHQAFQRLQATLQPAHDLSPANATTGLLPGMTAEQVKNLEALQARADQVLTTIDATLRVVFESMQRNLESYQDSLTRGLERMHGLGQQSEAQFAALLNHLAQRLGQEASAYLNASLQTQGLIAPEAPVARETVRPGSAAPAALPTDAIAEEALPFAGSEIGRGGAEVSVFSPSSPSPSRTSPSAHRSETLQLDDLDLSDFNLDALDTSLIDAEGADLEALPLAEGGPEAGTLDLGSDDRDIDDSPTEMLRERGAEPTNTLPTAVMAEAETLDFLNQLAETLDAPALVQAAESQSSPATPTSWTDSSTTAELRELYQSLFGSDEFAGAAPATPPAATPDSPPTSVPTLDNLFGELDATIHPDSAYLDSPGETLREQLDTEPSGSDTLLFEGETSASPGLEPAADLSADWTDLSLGIEDVAPLGTLPEPTASSQETRPSSLEDFFFPEAAPAGSSLLSADAAPSVEAELSLAGSPDVEAESIPRGERDANAWLEEAALEQLSEPATVEPAPRTAAPDLPDLDTDPFNLSALAADFAAEQETAATGPDLAALLADIGATGAMPGDVAAIETGSVSASLEDNFDTAAPDEDLLAPEDLQSPPGPELLQIDDQTLQQLSEDLFSLESSELATPGELPSFPPLEGDHSVSPTETRPSLGDDFGQPAAALDLAPQTTAFSVEDFAADLLGGLGGDDRAIAAAHPSLSAPETRASEQDLDPSLAALEDLFTDSLSPDLPPEPPPPEPVASPTPKGFVDEDAARTDGGLLDDLFADFGELEVASQTAENNLASFQAEFPVWDEDSAKKKF
ncbi:hypothetical protein OOK60_05335 [Trichothermofontia sichuanensis B231]|uniref:hypothetical protein n=1 Tax=Trichothermofontia sichuanensis TaxID=3045816 RepID=UPI0022473A50|nr:hypothetical protein [Trichothermofontia sichuanensis]UZQ55498.1 hypothetical protein OOK60_05335 [Trichothermofontia sichuanensis B231]